METNVIYNEDCYEGIKKIPDKSVDLIITDPPYLIKDLEIKAAKPTGILKERGNVNHIKEMASTNLGCGIDLKILNEFVRVMKKINIYLWCNKEQIYDYIGYFVKQLGCNFEILIWAKSNPTPFLNGHYLKDKEYCLYFWEKGVELKPEYDKGKTVWYSSTNVEDKELYDHPTIKPLDIIKTLIENSSKWGGGNIR